MGKRDLVQLSGPGMEVAIRTDSNPKMLRLAAVVDGHSNWMHIETDDVKETHKWLGLWLDSVGAAPEPSKLELDLLEWADQMEEESPGVGKFFATELRSRISASVGRKQ